MVCSSEADSEKNLEVQDTKRNSMCEMIKVERGSVRQRKPPILMLASLAKEMENETSDQDPRLWYRFSMLYIYIVVVVGR